MDPTVDPMGVCARGRTACGRMVRGRMVRGRLGVGGCSVILTISPSLMARSPSHQRRG